MNDTNRVEQRLAEIADVLSMSTDALVALYAQSEGPHASLESEAIEIAENFRRLDPVVRQMLLRLSRLYIRLPQPS